MILPMCYVSSIVRLVRACCFPEDPCLCADRPASAAVLPHMLMFQRSVGPPPTGPQSNKDLSQSLIHQSLVVENLRCRNQLAQNGLTIANQVRLTPSQADGVSCHLQVDRKPVGSS